jgi:hypothetical protein
MKQFLSSGEAGNSFMTIEIQYLSLLDSFAYSKIQEASAKMFYGLLREAKGAQLLTFRAVTSSQAVDGEE